MSASQSKTTRKRSKLERCDEYRDSGIPFGNPKRIHTGQVLCLPGKTTARSTAASQEDDIQMEGERQLKAMAERQLKTDITMAELLSQHRHFTEAGEYNPAVKEIQGIARLSEYQEIAKGDDRVETLRHYGLTDDEIQLKLSREGILADLNLKAPQKSTFGVNPDIEEERLSKIEAKIKAREATYPSMDTFRGIKEVSRQEQDIEKSIFHGSRHSGLVLNNLLIQKKTAVTGDPNDPINQLPQILEDMQEKAKLKIKEKRKRRKNRHKQSKNVVNTHTKESNDKLHSAYDREEVIGCLTYEEMIALNQPLKKCLSETPRNGPPSESVHTSLQSLTISVNGQETSHSQTVLQVNMNCHNGGEKPLVQESTLSQRDKESCKELLGTEMERKVLRGPVEQLPVEAIMRDRLSIEEIKKMHKFENYEPGQPNNVLYVKNLSPRICEADLVSLFGRFQNEMGPHIVYRLMTGRMKGQAFVTFDNTSTATEALNLINGFQFHGRPIIVQYGKRSVS